MVSNQPYNGYQAPPPPQGQAPHQSPVHYSQGPIQQFPPAQPYPPGQQPTYQSHHPGHSVSHIPQTQGHPQQYAPAQPPNYQTPPGYQHQVSHVQPPQAPPGQYPQPHQYPPVQQPTYQSHHPGHSVSQAPPGQGHPQQYAPAQQPNYQTSPYGVAAPPTPAQHQQQYQQQAAQFATPPSAQGQLQTTAQSLLKTGKGFLGNLASNIKSKYPNSPVPTSSTTSYTGEPPKPTYDPAQHPTQTPISPTNSFPLPYGQAQSQPQLGHPHHTPPTPQQSISPAAPGYPPIPHQAPHIASPVQHHPGLPGQNPQPGVGPAQYAQQQPQQPQQPQHYQPSGHAGIPGAIPQHAQSPPVGAAPYPQPVLHHQQSNLYQPAPPPQGNYYYTQPTGAAASPSHVQSSHVPSPQQQHQSTPPQLSHHASWQQQAAASNGSFNPTVSPPTSQPVSQTAPQVGSPGHPGLHQQPQSHQQPGAVSVYATTSPAPASQPMHNVAPSPSHTQSPSQAMPPQQQYYQSPVPQAQVHHYQQQVGIVQPNPEIPAMAVSAPQAASYTAGQYDPASVAPRPYQTQSPYQQNQSPALQQQPSATPLSQVQQGAQLPHGSHQPEQSVQAGGGPAPAVTQHLPTYSQDHNNPPGSSRQYQPSGIHSGPIPEASQYQPYTPVTGQQPPQAQYPQNPQQTITSPVDQQHHASPPPHLREHPNTTSIAQAPGSSSAVAGGQAYQPYQPADQLPNLNQPAALATNPNPDQSAPNGYQQDPLASLSTQMSNLNVQNGHQQSAAPVASPVPSQDGPRGPPPCQATGMASDTLPFCPEERTVAYPLDWYRFIAVPQCVICTRCYSDHVAGSNLAGHFERYHSPEGVESSCDFWCPRVKETLWPQALQTNDITPLHAYMEKKMTILACKGRVWSTGADGVKWWGMVNNDIDGFISCEACYEDNVVGTGFESRFSPYRPQGQDEKWMCDMCIPYITKMAVKMSKLNNWNGFVEAAKGRIHLPVCEGRDEESNNGHWILPRRRIKDMHICEACYLDKLALTQFGNEFERHQRAEGFDAFLESIGQRWKCSLTDTAVSMSIALEAAIYRRDFEVFWNAANAICSLVPCTEHGIVRGTWWTVSGGCPDYNVCEACYKGIVETSNLERFFESVERDPTIDIVCNFCPKSPRWGMFITKFAEAIDKGVFSYYTDYVKKWAGVPTCPGIKNREKSKWWGYPEALACQNCWLSFVADTPLGESVPVKGVYDERTLICQLWSPRMRNMWLSACAAGPPGSPESQKALDDFRAFGTRRVQVYNATVPHVEMMLQMMNMKTMQAMQQGQLSLMYQGMNSMAAISGTTDGYLHGNSSIGYYETENGVTAANMMNNMHSGMADANKMSDWMQIEQFRAAWMEVE